MTSQPAADPRDHQPVREFDRQLQALYEAAGCPPYSTVIRQAAARKPPVKLDDASISDWRFGKSVPAETSEEKLRALVEILTEFAQKLAQKNHKAYQAPLFGVWKRWRTEAWDQTHAGRKGGRPRTRRLTDGGQHSETQDDSTRLEAYLADVCRHGDPVEPYVDQFVVSWREGRSGDRSMAQPASAAVFGAGPLVVLIGDPGGGKSELLRRHRLDVCHQWKAGVRSAALPVVVTAASVGDTPLGTPFFAEAPAPGSQWLVLLDGLDEITNAQARRQVLRDTVRWVAERRETHRLVVATRQLAKQELRDLAEAAPVCFELLRFAADDVCELATAWLAPQQVDGLLAAVNDAQLADLVTLPMVGSILCQLYRLHPDRPLGSTRGEIYDAFITYLMATTPRTETRPEHHAGKPDDAGAPAWLSPTVADRVVVLGTLPPADLRTVLTRVAARRRASSPARPVLDVLLEDDLTKAPAGVPVRWWKDVLIACFRRSGVLRQQGEELEFAHRTYEEFLAACAGCNLAELRRVLLSHRRRHWPWRPAPNYHRMAGWGWQLWTPADGENMSYLGFLVDRLTDAAAADLSRLPSSKGISGCTFLAHLKRLGTYLPTDVQVRAVAKLKRHIKVNKRAQFGASIDLHRVNEMDPNSLAMAETVAALAIDDSRIHAAEALLAFAETRAEGLTVLRELCRSRRLTSLQGRVAAATAIVRSGDESAVDLIVELASDPALDDDARIGVAWQLTDLRRQRGIDLLTGWIDARRGGDFWFKAALTLSAIDEAQGVARMKGIANDATCPNLIRINAAYCLALGNDPQGAEDLLHFARQPDLEEKLRVVAVHLLAEVDHPSAETVRKELYQNPNLTPRSRRSLRRLPPAK